MQRLKAKKRFQSPPPPTPPFNFGYLFITNMSQKIVCYYKRRVWNTAESTNIKIFHPCGSKMLLTIIISKVSIIIDTKDIEEL